MMEFKSVNDLITYSFRELEEEVDYLGGVQTKMASFTRDEYDALINILDKFFYKNSYPAVVSLVAENIQVIIDTIRVVKTETKQPFMGIRARGSQLTLVNATADLFTRVWGATGAKTFEKDLTSTGSTDYIGTSANPESVGEEEGYVFLGFLEEEPTPKINKVLLTKNNDPFPYITLPWEAQEVNLACLPEPWILQPEVTYYVQAYAYKTGTTSMVPIAFKILQGKNVLSL